MAREIEKRQNMAADLARQNPGVPDPRCSCSSWGSWHGGATAPAPPGQQIDETS